MPLMDGFEVLQWVRQQPGLEAIRIVVLTSSSEIRDVNDAYHLGTNSYLVKPNEFSEYVQTCKAIKEYWLRMDQAPEASRPPVAPQAPPPRSPGAK